MIGFLKGKLLASEPNRILLDVNGVGYNVRVPFSTYCEIERIGPDKDIELFVRTHVREDAFDLYGFFTSEEKRVFEHLVSVNGIGPRLAQVVMSGMSWEDIYGQNSNTPPHPTSPPPTKKPLSQSRKLPCSFLLSPNVLPL